MKKLSKEQMKKVIGGDGTLIGHIDDGENGIVCSTKDCLYYKLPTDHSPTSGKCMSMSGPMQTGCGCEGKVVDTGCNL